jgi:hypothetical protein
VFIWDVESGCHPADSSAQFMVTCGHRYCWPRGYSTGMVVEYFGFTAEVACWY